jgi:hypothetical protein
VRFAALLASLAMAAPLAALADTGDLLPPDDFMPGWHRDGDPQVYRGAELFGHINGGSEIFLELGFDHLHIQHFCDDEGQAVTAEIYVMDDPIAALGIYLIRINGREQPNPGILQRHSTNPRQVTVVVGNLLVISTNPGGLASLNPISTELARQIAKLAPEPPPVDPFAALPVEGRIHLSERVIAGPFTLSELFTLGSGDILSLASAKRAVAADYAVEGGDPITLISVTHSSAAAARTALKHLTSHLDSYLEPIETTKTRLVFKDHWGRFGEARVVRSKVEVRLSLGERP